MWDSAGDIGDPTVSFGDTGKIISPSINVDDMLNPDGRNIDGRSDTKLPRSVNGNNDDRMDVSAAGDFGRDRSLTESTAPVALCGVGGDSID
jgi:hypothetical protein